MNLVADVFKELRGMFLADSRLTGGIVLLVATVDALLSASIIGSVVAGVVLLLGCLAILVATATREARDRGRR